MADMARYQAESVAAMAGGNLSVPRWLDLVDVKPEKAPDNRTGDEIAADVLTRLNLTMKGVEI